MSFPSAFDTLLRGDLLVFPEINILSSPRPLAKMTRERYGVIMPHM